MNSKEIPPDLYNLNGHISFPAYICSNMCQHCNTIMSVNVSLITHIWSTLFQTQAENEYTMCLLYEFTEFIAQKMLQKVMNLCLYIYIQ